MLMLGANINSGCYHYQCVIIISINNQFRSNVCLFSVFSIDFISSILSFYLTTVNYSITIVAQKLLQHGH